MMLDINPEIVCFIIDKAHEFHAKEEVSIPEVPNSPTDDWALQVLADHQDDLTYKELHALLTDLEPDQQHQLLALMWLGRGDYMVDEWGEALGDAEGVYSDYMMENLIATPLLADYLIEGLDLMGYTCEAP